MVPNFWKDKDKNLVNENLFSEEAEKIANEVANEKKSKPAQIRKFYDFLLHYNNKLKEHPDQFQALLPYIKMIHARIAYAKGRNLIGDNFAKFINESINQVKDQKDFELFMTLFEAFLGFYKEKEERRKE